MSIRLRFTLFYNVILALTLTVFGLALYLIQSQTSYDAIKKNVIHGSDTAGASVLQEVAKANGSTIDLPATQSGPPHPPVPFQNFSSDQAFRSLPEREIVRVLDPAGNLVASPFGRSEDALPLSEGCMQQVTNQNDCWETAPALGEQMLIYNRPINSNGKVVYILQVARPLTERNNSLDVLGLTLIIASLVTMVAATGIGWVLSGITLTPINRITHTAQTIGDERDFTRRVQYAGPQDEVGQLATTFNSMLVRLEDAYQQVAHSLETQRNFLADVSHELRTPLTTLRGNLGLLRRVPAIPADEQADILSDMVDESDRLIRLVNDLLVLARADAGRILKHEPLDVYPVLDETCRQARQLEPKRLVKLDAQSELSIIGDRDAFKQVVLILLDNALKHSNGDIRVMTVASDNHVDISVQDSGEGIAPEKLAHVFERFYKGDEKNMNQGFGLGLPIAKSLVEGQGGTITIESEIGKGSTVTMRFPKSA